MFFSTFGGFFVLDCFGGRPWHPVAPTGLARRLPSHSPPAYIQQMTEAAPKCQKQTRSRTPPKAGSHRSRSNGMGRLSQSITGQPGRKCNSCRSIRTFIRPCIRFHKKFNENRIKPYQNTKVFTQNPMEVPSKLIRNSHQKDRI